MKTLVAIIAVLPSTAVLADIDRTMWKTPEEIDSPRSREYVAERGAAAQMRSLEVYRKEIVSCDQLPPDKAIPILRNAVYKLPKYNIYQVKERIEVFDLARDKMLSIPGHAEYFADLIEKERAALKPEEYRGSYDNHRLWYLRDTLRHLPSPETVKVLSRYLDDDRDIPQSEPASDGGGTVANSHIAMEALLLLELRDAPYPPGRWYWYRSTKELATVRAWFAPIKAGQRTFSFRGQAVDYRFKPDGTWVSNPIANPPDDPPYPPKPKLTPASPAPTKPQAVTTQTNQPALWPWLSSMLLVALGILILIWRIKSRSARTSP